MIVGWRELSRRKTVGMNAGDLFFLRLTDLRLIELPKLWSFYESSHTSTWSLLKELRVRRYRKVRSFSLACEFQSCQGTITSENQRALFSFEKVRSLISSFLLYSPLVYVHSFRCFVILCRKLKLSNILCLLILT